MAYIRLIVLVLVMEVIITVVVGLGMYVGFSVFPFMQAPVTTSGTAVQSAGVNATIPLYMPSLSDLKAPYTYLKNNGQSAWGIMAFAVSAAIIVMQSFIRGMYLGGLKGWVQDRRTVPLLACGRRYFRDLLAWSIFQHLIGVVIIFIAAVFFPVSLILMIVLLFYSLTPYLIVLQDLPFHESLAKAPRLFRRYFKSLLPLALLALLCTMIISSFRSLMPPMGYAVPLVAYACIGTLLIGALMNQLTMKLKEDLERTPNLPFGEFRSRRTVNYLSVLLVPAVVAAGIYAYTGKHLNVLDFGSKKELNGVSFHSNFSDVFYSSEQRYTAYEWQANDYRISIRLPDLTGDQKPDELRGIAVITWQVSEERSVVNGNITNHYVEPVTRKSRLMYRLVRETSEDGSSYYSSMNGSASILLGKERPQDPLAVQVMLSGDGSQLFVLQYPARFDISQVFRVSNDGRYLITGTSPVNPADFRTYWFSAEQRADQVFEILAAKNQANYIPSLNRSYLALACALQEGDGRMVVEVLDTMRRGDVDVQAPDWDEKTWSDYLRSQYKGIDMQQTLAYMSEAGAQGTYAGMEQVDESNEKTGLYKFEVSFPRDPIPILYKESKEDGRLLSVQVMIGES
ncbi:hypothetical protein [Paenibacillus montanisoli]|uniref:Uncharacterized protein n=1 Tax=Paenibacillus montanisoli TaxID=2081970 RepID=A0A328U1D4_9BACL|nr:hypothetical protein [Paenibacillus montanisoli]RAP75872.1 hypothetical protein DL346_10585 [Paenibacillus montanisoli]